MNKHYLEMCLKALPNVLLLIETKKETDWAGKWSWKKMKQVIRKNVFTATVKWDQGREIKGTGLPGYSFPSGRDQPYAAPVCEEKTSAKQKENLTPTTG